MISRLQEAWASALGESLDRARPLVHIPDNAVYRIDRVPKGEDRLPDLFHRASYLCKATTKRYGGGHWAFGASRG